jgi:hypothetical protein
LQSKDSKNTKNATKVALQTLTAYIIEADKDVNLCDCSPSQSLPFHIHGHCMEYFIGPFEKRVVYNVNFQFTREMYT